MLNEIIVVITFISSFFSRTEECSGKYINCESLEDGNCSNRNLSNFTCLPSVNLTQLDLSNNEFTLMPECIFEEYLNLISLNMSGNTLLGYNSMLLEGLTSNLQTLDISNCGIRNINLNGLPNLKAINISENRLKGINKDLFKRNTKLQQVNISNNYITSLDITTFADLTELLHLDLSSNKLTKLEQNLFAANKQLYSLNLSNNPLKIFKSINSPSLRVLKLQQCEVNSINFNAFEMLLSIEILDLSRNQLEMIAIPKLMFSNTLSELDLSSNRINKLHLNVFRNFTSLTSLNLANNKLTSMKLMTFFKHNPNLKNLTLTDNPLICDCDYNNYNYLKNKLSEYLRCINPHIHVEEKWILACDNQVQKLSVWVPIIYICFGLFIIVVISHIPNGLFKRQTSTVSTIDQIELPEIKVNLQ